MKPGDRVGAIRNSKDDEVFFFGWGVYDGDFEPPNLLGSTAEEWRKEYGFVPKNPRITLDNGQVVWGCQCWWGSEESVKKMVEGKKITIVPTPQEEDDVRPN